MTTNQRVGFVYRVLEDNQREHPLTDLQLMNLQHYADTGKWISEDVKEFEEFRKASIPIKELIKIAESSERLLSRIDKSGRDELMDWGRRDRLEELEKYVDKLKNKYESIERQRVELNSKLYSARTEYEKVASEYYSIVSDSEDCHHLYKDIVDNMEKKFQHIYCKYPNGEVWSCRVTRIANKLTFSPCIHHPELEDKEEIPLDS